MANLETIANPVVVTMILSACGLGIGFMVIFFVALAGEEKHARSCNAIRLPVVNSEAETPSAADSSLRPALSPAAYVAMGVARITTALASKNGPRNSDLSFDRLHLVGRDRSRSELYLPGQRMKLKRTGTRI